MSVYEATERSIQAAIEQDRLDPDVSAGPIAAILRLAQNIDAPLVSDKLDTVSIPSYLKFCQELNLTPAKIVPKDKTKEQDKAGGALASLRAVPDA